MQEAISFNEYGKNTFKIGAKDSEDLDKTLFNKAKKNKRVKTDEEAKQISVDSRKLMDEYSKIKYKT